MSNKQVFTTEVVKGVGKSVGLGLGTVAFVGTVGFLVGGPVGALAALKAGIGLGAVAAGSSGNGGSGSNS